MSRYLKDIILIAAILILTAGFVVIVLHNGPTSPVKVIIDCDMGYMNDDAMALSMLIRAEEQGLVEIMGITLEGGNDFIDASYEDHGEIKYGSAKCIDDFLTSIGRIDIPVYRGTDLPSDMDIDHIQELADFYQGLDYEKTNDGYGAIYHFGSLDPDMVCDSNEAVDYLIDSVRTNPKEIVIFAIGPTMNIARAVQKDPDFAPNVKAIYYMGGALGDTCIMENVNSEKLEGIEGANVTVYAEYNVIYDPASFGICITAPFESQYVIPGSCNVSINQSIADVFIANSDANSIAELWANRYREYIPEFPYWDPLTVYAFLCPDKIVNKSTEYITINTDRDSKYIGRTDGFTLEEYEQLSEDEQARCGKAEVVSEMDGFWDYACELLCD